MSGALEFMVLIVMVGVLACVIGCLVLLYLLIDDQLYRRKKNRPGHIIARTEATNGR